MDPLVEKIREILQPIFDREQVYLVDMELRGNRGNQVLRILADTEQGITLEEITRLTREINDALDMYDPIPGSYRLEVSSPGLDRPLQHLWQFRRNIGRELKVLYEESGERKKVIGALVAADEEQIVLQVAGEELSIPRSAIAQAKVRVKW
ncbi:MAG: ribosome maturation factor RimP [Calditrichaeota bacterium]|nr:MAG: ribosome maturation factor RimP [Calditrichota bacterium]